MDEVLLFLNQPTVLWSLLATAIIAVLLDYLFPVDWLAYIGYALFAVFVGATVPVGPWSSLGIAFAVFVLMLVLHELIFSRFLTNAPRWERQQASDPSPSAPGDNQTG